MKFAKKNIDMALRRRGKSAAAVLIFAGFIFSSVGMHNWRADNSHSPLTFAGRKCLTLVIAVHSNCPDSWATTSAAMRICHRVPGEVKLTVLFLGKEDDISRNPAFAGLAKMKSQILSDLNGEAARRIGLTNFGQALLFSPNGNLLYSGSITPSANRSGNPGEEVVIELINGSTVSSSGAAPYGCSLDASTHTHEHGLKTAFK